MVYDDRIEGQFKPNAGERRDLFVTQRVNEDIAATSCWGSQQIGLFPGAKHDGVFALWYGKGPGLDRSVDAIRHANHAGTAPHGGVLAVVGDDHGMKSTDVVAACEATFTDLMMPVLFPGTVAEMIDYGLIGWEMSRFSGAWVGMKTVANTLDTATSIAVDAKGPAIIRPNHPLPPDGVHIRLPDPWAVQEPRLVRHKLPAALAFARVNGLNRLLIEAPRPRLGIVCAGTAAYDVLEALRGVGLDRQRAAEAGISVLKLGLVHPLDEDLIRRFANGLEEILVIEEKRRLIEQGIKDALYGLPDARRPRVVGRFDEAGGLLVDDIGELGPNGIVRAIAARLARFHSGPALIERIAFLDRKARARMARERLPIVRSPYFCSGCPHSTSTRVPDGSRAHGGVGCHYMSTLMDRGVSTHTHMGGEGATWLGQAPFVGTRHVFQNLGDGTYFHSGLLAIRACVAAGANITYKILYNDAVAMTGGQPIDGELTPQAVTRQVWAEGVRRIVVVSEDPGRYTVRSGFAPGTTIEHRRRLDAVQRDLRETPGVSVLLYDQTCAAEKRRRRKKGELPDPSGRVFINERVCEGCGDCSVKSSCLSVVPVDTDYGRKRRIDQSSCNKDMSCIEGFCPSFVTVEGGRLRKAAKAGALLPKTGLLPEPQRPVLAPDRTYNILVTGIGGTGVVTIGAMITMAAHLEGLAAAAVDQFGMAQKGGAVTSHIRLATATDDILAVQIDAGAADLLLGCDSLVTAADLALETIDPARTHVVINTHEAITGHFTRNPDLRFPSASIDGRLAAAAGKDRLDWIDATRIATRLLGDAIATNMLMLGYAYQKGLIPITAQGIERAIELNGVAVAANQETFRLGRRLVIDPKSIASLVEAEDSGHPPSQAGTLDDRRAGDLEQYQNAAYAQRYRAIVTKARQTEALHTPGRTGFTDAVAQGLYRLMAYKDEYEVARLYASPAFARSLADTFEPGYGLRLHLAPPLFAQRDPDTGLPRKHAFGPWILTAMRLLARLKGLRGTLLDPFGHTAERKQERALISEYEALITRLCSGLSADNHDQAVALAAVYDSVRGFGHVKARNLTAMAAQRDALLALWCRDDGQVTAQAAE